VTVPGAPRDARLDCGWFGGTGELVVAWEFDGRDVGQEHLVGNPTKGKAGNLQKKFKRASAQLRIQALYSLRNGHALPLMRAQTPGLLQPHARVVADEQLMCRGISDVVKDAVAAAKAVNASLLPSSASRRETIAATGV
jgi:hypothetical protein